MPTSIPAAPGLIQSPAMAAGGNDEDIGGVALGSEIAGTRVRDRHGAVLANQELRHRLADQIRTSQDQRLHATLRRCGAEGVF